MYEVLALRSTSEVLVAVQTRTGKHVDGTCWFRRLAGSTSSSCSIIRHWQGKDQTVETFSLNHEYQVPIMVMRAVLDLNACWQHLCDLDIAFFWQKSVLFEFKCGLAGLVNDNRFIIHVLNRQLIISWVLPHKADSICFTSWWASTVSKSWVSTSGHSVDLSCRSDVHNELTSSIVMH